MAKIKGETLMAVLAGIAILYMIYNYSRTKSISGMTDSSLGGSAVNGSGEPGWSSSKQGAVAPAGPETPESLLPGDQNSAWINSLGEGPLKAMAGIKAGDLIGIPSCVKRNMNLSIRDDPAIAKINTGPWLQSTIESCKTRGFELGCEGGNRSM